MADKVRWGFISTGMIANIFARALDTLPDAELVAVGSRSQEKADEFGKKYNVPHCYGNYEDLVNDPDVDVVYVGTPHPFHKENCLIGLEAGKAVLCEKPFTINAAEAREVIESAREKKLFLMEAMWTRYIPAIVKLRELLAEGAIGELRMLHADFGFRGAYNPEGRHLKLELGGGALLDVGVYVISFASMVFGPPKRIAGFPHIGETGADEQAGMVFGYDDGKLSLLSCAVRTTTPQSAVVIGAEGRIHLHNPFYRSPGLTICRQGKDDEVIDIPLEGNGYNYEAAEVMRCLREGKLENDVMPLDETITIVETMDELRRQWGLEYPTE